MIRLYWDRGKAWRIGRLQGLHDSVPVVYTERAGLRRYPLRIWAWRAGLNG